LPPTVDTEPPEVVEEALVTVVDGLAFTLSAADTACVPLATEDDTPVDAMTVEVVVAPTCKVWVLVPTSPPLPKPLGIAIVSLTMNGVLDELDD